MQQLSLSKEASDILKAMYQKYLLCKEDNATERTARHMGDLETIHRTYAADLPFEDVLDYCNELVQNGLLHTICSSGTIYDSELTAAGVAYMRDSGARIAQKWFDTIGTIINIVKK